MDISKKLVLMAATAIIGLVVIGGLSYGIVQNMTEALTNSNGRVIPSIQTIYQLKSNQQTLALNVYRHISNTNPEQLQDIEKTIETAAAGMRAALSKYQGLVRTDKGRELLKAEAEAADEYLKLLPPVLEKSRSNDKAGALERSAAMATSRAKLAKLIDEHVALNDELADASAADAESRSSQGIALTILITLSVSVFLGVISFRVIRGTRRSLSSMQSAIQRIEGNLDFTVHAEVIGNDEIARVSQSLNRLIDRLRTNLRTIADNAHRLSDAAAQLSTNATQVASASSHQSDSASSMAASVEQMTVSISHVSSRSEEAHALSTESGRYAAEGESVIARTVDDINHISRSVGSASERIQDLEGNSENISTIIGVIKEVAEQTNLLALNAAIEAARAGEQGRGFAVVADEVRKLAERTANSTTQIATMIESIRNVTKDVSMEMGSTVALVSTGVSRASNASDAIKMISESSLRAVLMVEEITSAIREQSQASNTIAGSVEEIAQMAEESSAAAKNTESSAHELDDIAKALSKIVADYRL